MKDNVCIVKCVHILSTLFKLVAHFCSYFTVSGMAKWLRHLLAEWKVPGSNLTMGKVSEKVSVKKFRGEGQPSSACMMEDRMMGVLLNS